MARRGLSAFLIGLMTVLNGTVMLLDPDYTLSPGACIMRSRAGRPASTTVFALRSAVTTSLRARSANTWPKDRSSLKGPMSSYRIRRHIPSRHFPPSLPTFARGAPSVVAPRPPLTRSDHGPSLPADGFRVGGRDASGFRERSATTGSGAASGQRMPFPDYVSAQGPVPTPWTQVGPVVFSRLRRAAPGDLQRPCGCAWSNSGRMVENVSRRARSVDVFQQGRFLFPCQPLTSPLPKSQPKCIKG